MRHPFNADRATRFRPNCTRSVLPKRAQISSRRLDMAARASYLPGLAVPAYDTPNRRSTRKCPFMSVPYRIEGYVITCGGGMIADASAVMPEALKIEADHRFLERELDRFDVLVHGRHSHEGQPNSPRRRRLVVTRKIPTITPDPDPEVDAQTTTQGGRPST